MVRRALALGAAVWLGPGGALAADGPPASVARRCSAEPAATWALCVADGSKAAGFFEQAASWYESQAAGEPGASAASALSEAAALRALLGQPEQARRDLAALERTRAPARQKLRTRLALAARLAEQGQRAEARALLASSPGPVAPADPLALAALAQRARLLLASGERAEAERVYRGLVMRVDPRLLRPRSAEELGSDPLAPRRPPGPWPEGDPAALAAEALFVLAERSQRAAEAIATPVYQGPNERGAIVRFLTEKASPWLVARREAAERADAEFVRVLAVEPAPPPRWAIAAARRVGDLWASLYRDTRSLPVPPWTAPAALQTAYFMRLDPIDDVFKLRAKQAFAYCLRQAATQAHHDENVDACEAWLARNARAEYGESEGYRPTPSLDSAGPPAPAPWPYRGGRP